MRRVVVVGVNSIYATRYHTERVLGSLVRACPPSPVIAVRAAVGATVRVRVQLIGHARNNR